MSINEVIVMIVIGFFCLGALDKSLGNKLGIGQRFTDGFMTMGSLALAMIGIISLAPVLASILTPIISPIYGLVGADPAAFANTILAIDMGGYALAEEMAKHPDAAIFAWVFLGTMMGPTIVFTIPVALGIIEKEDQQYFAKGVLLGIITVPVGCLIGGLVANIPIMIIVSNLIPTIIISLLISVGLWKKPEKMIIGFTIFAKCIEILALFGLVAIVIETFTNITIIPNLTPIEEGIKIVGMIAIFLAGAFPMVKLISILFKKPLIKIGTLLGISETSTTGLIASLAHHIPMFTILKDMEPRGKVINVAFAVSGAFVFGSHLGFVAGINPELVFAMIIGKLAGGLSAVMLALVLTPKSEGIVKIKTSAG
ncbi:ethanolamine utilization protein EutH [Anaerobacillus isosaccharinicus]|uniref:Ethanolamine utilization protein EutH n=1 Tax=Anaerobacillus isosaccharinicus TaxID=1532552 RepID=A0A1S2M8C7_9BACI|nr:ethanolamine utilization protein EutH [Anaerobacillus isosaccharinicus]MBA5586746.1 ethanolamine utilization protein EutH [Anaerobacillus isosaccharinicus]QOY35032.1 ethanolamine utilization protein EutH [Anaerobacillus isosaccharinicus]